MSSNKKCLYPESSYSGRGSDSDSRKFLNEDLGSEINDCSGVSLPHEVICVPIKAKHK